MIKRSTLFLFSLLQFINLIGQDTIVSKEMDTIYCKIEKESKYSIYYSKLESKNRDTSYINYASILWYTKEGRKTIPKINAEQSAIGNKFRASFNLGFGYRLAEENDALSEQLNAHARGLRIGFQYNFDAHYYSINKIGYGLKFSRFSVSNSSSGITLINAIYGQDTSISIEDNIRVTFLGPSLSLSLLRYKKNALYLNIAVGYIWYRNDAIAIQSIMFKGNTIAGSADLSYDIPLNENLKMGFQLSYIGGVLNSGEFSTKDGSRTISSTEETREILRRIEFSVGIRFVK